MCRTGDQLAYAWLAGILKKGLSTGKMAAPSWLLVPLKLSFTVVSSGSTHLTFPKPLPLHPPWLLFDNSLWVRTWVTEALAVTFSLVSLQYDQMFPHSGLHHTGFMLLCKHFTHFSFTEHFTGQLNLTLTLVWRRGDTFESCPT